MSCCSTPLRCSFTGGSTTVYCQTGEIATGGGFDITDAESDQNRAFLRLGNGNTLRSLTLTYLDTPEPLDDPYRFFRW